MAKKIETVLSAVVVWTNGRNGGVLTTMRIMLHGVNLTPVPVATRTAGAARGYSQREALADFHRNKANASLWTLFEGYEIAENLKLVA